MSLQTEIESIYHQINQLDKARENLLIKLKQLEHKQDIIDLAIDDDIRESMKIEIDRIEKMAPEERDKEKKKKERL